MDQKIVDYLKINTLKRLNNAQNSEFRSINQRKTSNRLHNNCNSQMWESFLVCFNSVVVCHLLLNNSNSSINVNKYKRIINILFKTKISIYLKFIFDGFLLIFYNKLCYKNEALNLILFIYSKYLYWQNSQAYAFRVRV